MSFDLRDTPVRDDLAGRAFEGVVRAGSYVDPDRRVAKVAAAPLRRAPNADAEQLDQVLFGELFDVLEEGGGFAWGQARRDGYVGFVETCRLADGAALPTHRVAAVRTYAFLEPSIKSRALGPYSINALVTVEAREGRFAKAANSGWFVEGHLAPIGVFEDDPAAVAERFLGAPYLWGGRESLGLDCSGLVQQALMACGRACARDADQQQRLGAPTDTLRRGDLVFWTGHVGMMLDDTRLIHANAYHMAVAIEPLAQTRARYLENGVGEPTAYRRP